MTQASVAFDRASDYYDQTRGFPMGVEQEAIAVIARIGDLTPDMRLLEIGIGTGRIALPLAPYVGAIYGVDLALPMVERLRAKQTDEGVYPVIANALHLPFADESFDALVAVHIFHLIPSYADALLEAARVLKPNGLLLHAWGERHSENRLDQVWKNAVERDWSAPGAMDWAQRGTFLTDHGWLAGDHDAHKYTVSQAPADYLAGVRGRIYSSMWFLPDEVHQRGIAALEAFIAENYDDPTLPVQIETAFQVQAYQKPSV